MSSWYVTFCADAVAGLTGAIWVLGACEEERPPPRYPVTFYAHADSNTPLAGVQVTANGAELGTTNEDGLLAVTLTGPEGTAVRVGAQCPDGHRNPESIPVLTLRRVVSLDPAAANGIFAATHGLEVKLQ